MDSHTGVFDAIVRGDIKAVINALDNEETVDCADDNGYTALHWCSATEQSERLVPALIALGASIESFDKFRRTPLHVFGARGCITGTACLLHYGANPNALDDDKNTPLHYAAANGSEDVIRLLLAYGASTSAINTQGLSPHDMNRSTVSL